MDYSLYRLALFFLVYAFLGWLSEEVFALVRHGKLVNRGFLTGPVCPIYGFGMIIIILCLTPVQDILPLLFLGSAVLTTLLEFVTGYVLEKFFKTKWWDYSEEHFNVKGYICLKFSILWGFAGVFIMDIVHPSVMKLLDKLSYKAGLVIIAVSAVLFAVDLTTTLVSMIDLHKGVAKLEELSAKAEEFRLKLEHMAGSGSEFIEERTDELKAEFARQREQISEARLALSDELHRRHRRFFSAFPHFEKGERFEKLREAIEEYREKRGNNR